MTTSFKYTDYPAGYTVGAHGLLVKKSFYQAEARLTAEPTTASLESQASAVTDKEPVGRNKQRPELPANALLLEAVRWSAAHRPRGTRTVVDAAGALELTAAKPRARLNDGPTIRDTELDRIPYRIARRGLHRLIGKLPRTWRLEIARLRAEYPNGTEFWDHVESSLLLCERLKLPARISPVLLDGPPGVGKSAMITALSEAIKLRLYRLQCESSESASALTGSDRHWGNSAPGLVLDALVDGPVCNPIIMLDEVEKAPRGGNFGSLTNALYGLLEETSARRFTDNSCPYVPLDASQISWLMTSNHMRMLPPPILSRIKAVTVHALDTEQSKTVWARIWSTEMKRSGLHGLLAR